MIEQNWINVFGEATKLKIMAEIYLRHYLESTSTSIKSCLFFMLAD